MVFNWMEWISNSKDEAQHFVMGKITTKILKLMNVKYKLTVI